MREAFKDGERNISNKREILKDRPREHNGDALLYLLFNPPLSLLPRKDQERIVHSQLSKDTGKIFDYTQGLFLHEALSGNGPSREILSISSIFATLNNVHSWAKDDEEDKNAEPDQDSLHSFSLDDVVKGCDIREMSFAWYLVFGFILGPAGSQFSEFISLVEGHPCPPRSNNLPFLPPRYVLKVEIEAGTNPEQKKH